MNWQIIIGPLVGAVIGYVTNKIAVEMLFRPLKPVYIGKFRVPFTPGIVPKGKDRLGKAIGNVVGNSLLTTDSIKDTLLSEKMKNDILFHIDSILKDLSTDDSTLGSKVKDTIGETAASSLGTAITETVAQKAGQGLLSMNLGELIANEVLEAVQAKVKGTMLAMMINASTLGPIVEEIKNRINQYIEEQGVEKAGGFIESEFRNFANQPLSEFCEGRDFESLKQTVLELYCSLIDNHAERLLTALNLSAIVEEKVCAMDVKEVEALVLSIMEKELGAIVNLGAVIGFILGLVNLLF